jgi:ribosomal protein S18 acetylase RimI-like enzyme
MASRFKRSLALPEELSRRGIALRGETDADFSFLQALYCAVRWPELEPTGWPDAAKHAFLSTQFSYQFRHYDAHYPETDFGIIEQDGKPIGRLYLDRGIPELRIVDVSLMPETRNAGIGTALLLAVCAEAQVEGRFVGIHVEKFNPAQRLYRRLGFAVAGENGPYWRMEWRPAAS